MLKIIEEVETFLILKSISTEHLVCTPGSPESKKRHHLGPSPLNLALAWCTHGLHHTDPLIHKVLSSR
jgi:hypothetical protein